MNAFISVYYYYWTFNTSLDCEWWWDRNICHPANSIRIHIHGLMTRQIWLRSSELYYSDCCLSLNHGILYSSNYYYTGFHGLNVPGSTQGRQLQVLNTRTSIVRLWRSKPHRTLTRSQRPPTPAQQRQSLSCLTRVEGNQLLSYRPYSVDILTYTAGL